MGANPPNSTIDPPVAVADNVWPAAQYAACLASGIQDAYSAILPTALVSTQDYVFPASCALAKGTASVGIRSSGSASNAVWFAPAGTTTFTASATMTKAAGTATAIAVPTTAGTYKLHVVDAQGNKLGESAALLRVNRRRGELPSNAGRVPPREGMGTLRGFPSQSTLRSPVDFPQKSGRPDSTPSMVSLRLIRSPAPVVVPAGDCLETFDRELDYVYGTLQRLGARPGDVEDLLQEVFVVLHRNWPNLDATRSLRPWLFGVAFRVVRTHRRRRAREAPHADLDPEDRAPTPEVWLQGQESLALLSEALQHVPASRLFVVVKHDLDGLGRHRVSRASCP